MLSQRDVLPYLLGKGLLRSSNVVRGTAQVVNASRRNSNFKVFCEPGWGCFVKQGLGSDRIASVTHEADVLRRLPPQLRNWLPKMRLFDDQCCVLVTGLDRQALNLREVHTRGCFPSRDPRDTGTALAALHSHRPLENRWLSEWKSPPWVLFAHRPNPSALVLRSAAGIQFIRLLQKFNSARVALEELAASWKPTSLVHADVRWDNLIRTRKGLIIVDWELAGLGDPFWDVGSMFAEYVMHWLRAIPFTAHVPPRESLARSRHSLQDMQPPLRAFWKAYRSGCPDVTQAGLWSSVRYAGARMIQSILEQLQWAPHLGGDSIYGLQVAVNFLERPHDAGEHLFGVPNP